MIEDYLAAIPLTTERNLPQLRESPTNGFVALNRRMNEQKTALPSSEELAAPRAGLAGKVVPTINLFV
jgi:hypothetical protein